MITGVLASAQLMSAGGAPPSIYIGYNTPGGSDETMTRYRAYAKKVTLATDGLIASIGAYLKTSTSDAKGGLMVALFEDNAGTPRYLLAASPGFQGGASGDELLMVSPSGGTPAYRWVHRSLGYWATAGDYWIAVMDPSLGHMHIAYDGSGNDRYYTAGGGWWADWGFYSPTTTGNQYSIRAEFKT